jgi:hypothetical protein
VSSTGARYRMSLISAVTSRGHMLLMDGQECLRRTSRAQLASGKRGWSAARGTRARGRNPAAQVASAQLLIS